MTDKTTAKLYNVDSIRKVTDERNKHTIDLRVIILWYPGYSVYRDENEQEMTEEIGLMLNNLAFAYESKHLWLIRGMYERYLASLLDENYNDMMLDTTLYDRHFMIARACKLSYKMFYDDILHVYEDGRVLVSYSNKAKKVLRGLRGVK